MKNLYELTAEYDELLAALDAAENEDEKNVYLEKLDELSGDIEHKAEAYAKIIKSKQAEAEAYKTEIVRLTANMRAAENVADRLKDRLLNAMTTSNITEIPTAIGKWRVQNNPWSAEIVDAEKVPIEWKIPQEPKIDRSGLVKHWKETGELVDGVQFLQRQGLRFK